MEDPRTILTLRFLRSFHFLLYRKGFPGVYDIDYRTWSGGLEIFQKSPSVAAVGIGGVYAFCREIVKFLEVGVPVCMADWEIGSKRLDE